MVQGSNVFLQRDVTLVLTKCNIVKRRVKRREKSSHEAIMNFLKYNENRMRTSAGGKRETNILIGVALVAGLTVISIIMLMSLLGNAILAMVCCKKSFKMKSM